MTKLSFVLVSLMAFSLSGCAVVLQLMGGGQKSTESPEYQLESMKKRVAEIDSTYYQDANGKNPAITSGWDAAGEEVTKHYDLAAEPMREADATEILSVDCNSERYSNKQNNAKTIWEKDAEGAAKFFAALPALAKTAIDRHARWAGFYFAHNGLGEEEYKGTAEVRRKSFADHPFDLDDLKKLINGLAACPHAPGDVKPTLMKMLDDAFEAQLPIINAMADDRLVESLKGKKMAQNAGQINAFDRRKFDKRIHNWLGDKYNIHAIRYGDEWDHIDEHRRVGDTLKYIKEDYTHINVYTDPGEGRPFYECHLLDGVKDLRRGVKRHVRWAHGPYSCSAVPKTP